MTNEWPKVTEIEFEGFTVKCTDYGLQVRDLSDGRCEVQHHMTFELGEQKGECWSRAGDTKDALAMIEAVVVAHRRAIGKPTELDTRGTRPS